AELERLCEMMADAAPAGATLARADIIIRQQEQRLECQRQLVESLERHGQSGLSLLARRLLADFTEALDSSRRIRALRRAEFGLPPDDHNAPATDGEREAAIKKTVAGEDERLGRFRETTV